MCAKIKNFIFGFLLLKKVFFSLSFVVIEKKKKFQKKIFLQIIFL